MTLPTAPRSPVDETRLMIQEAENNVGELVELITEMQHLLDRFKGQLMDTQYSVEVLADAPLFRITIDQ